MSQLQRIALTAAQIQGREILLTPEQQHYLSRVLRLKNGDRFVAIAPQGGWWQAVLQENKGQLLEPIPIATELPVTVSLIVAMPKGNGLEEIVRQTTELGVSAIYPVMSDRSLLKPSPQKIERWRRIAQEAAEQSERAQVPTIFEPMSFCDCLGQIAQITQITQITHLGQSTLTQESCQGAEPQKYQQKYQQKYICVARGDRPHLLNSLSKLSPFPFNSEAYSPEAYPQIFIATGPEGGWTTPEVEQAARAGFQPVSLGDRILRAVTAPVVALSLVAAYLES